MERVTRALDRELTQLMTFSADWGNWIDTYEFMCDAATRTSYDQHESSFLNSSGIELVAFLDRQGRYVWRQGYDAKVARSRCTMRCSMRKAWSRRIRFLDAIATVRATRASS